jgi:hypothetical protein
MEYEVVIPNKELTFVLDMEEGEELLSLAELFEICKKEFGELADLTKIKMETAYEQFQCFGYDLYDSGDYQCELTVTYHG